MLDLLIGQYRSSPNLRALLSIWLDVLRQEIEEPIKRLDQLKLIDEADGVWLDRIGERLGVNRPYSEDLATKEFGFDDAGVGFDQARIAGIVRLEPLTPIADEFYRRIIKARAIYDLGDGTIGSYILAVHQVDPTATITDNYDMSFNLTTDIEQDITIADNYGALPRPAGVKMNIINRGRFGFDEAGEAFDQGGLQ